MGSRYGGLKQLDPMGPGGETILDYSVFDAVRAGFDRVVFVIRRDFEREFRERIVARFDRHVDVALAFQSLDALPSGFTVPPGREKPWGTTHAILCGRGAIAAPFAAINADDFYGRDAFAVLGRRLSALPGDSTAYCMVGFTLANTLSEHGSVARGVCRTDDRGFLADIRELKQIARTAAGWRLTPRGRKVAEMVVRSHRLWEAWLGRHAELPVDHLHPPAEWVEHHLGTAVRQRLEADLGMGAADPHGSEIPPAA